MEKTTIKEGRYGYCKWNYVPRLHYLGPKHSFAHEIVRANLSFHVLLTVTTFPKSIQSNFTDTAIKKDGNVSSCCELY